MSPVSALLPPSSTDRSAAVFSPDPDRRYRYALERRWGDGPFALWVMLNPSTADEHKNDATIRRCIGFTKRWGGGGILVGNLYAYRDKNPDALKLVDDPVGPDNDVWLTTMAVRSSIVVAAWGAHRMAGRRSHVLIDLISKETLTLVTCLGTTKGGHPRHPVRLPYATPMAVWP